VRTRERDRGNEANFQAKLEELEVRDRDQKKVREGGDKDQV